MRRAFWAGGVGTAVFIAAACGGTTGGGASSGVNTRDGSASGGSSSNSGGQGAAPHTLNLFIETLTAASTGCLPRILMTDPVTGKIPCSILEVQKGAGAACDPNRGRSVPDSRFVPPALDRLQEQGVCDVSGTPACSTFTVCQLNEAGPACHQAGVPEPLAGWCYIDPAHNPSDDPSLVASCAANEQRSIRFVDASNATPAPGAVVMIACYGSSVVADGTGGGP